MSKRLRGCLGTFYRVESCHDRRWQQLGVWEPIVQSLTPQARRQQQRRKEPTAAVLDSQSVKDLYKRGGSGLRCGEENQGAETPLCGDFNPSFDETKFLNSL